MNMTSLDRYDIEISGYRVKFTGERYSIFAPSGRTIAFGLLFCKLGHASKAMRDIPCDGREDGLNVIHMVEALNGIFRPEEEFTRPDYQDETLVQERWPGRNKSLRRERETQKDVLVCQPLYNILIKGK